MTEPANPAQTPQPEAGGARTPDPIAELQERLAPQIEQATEYANEVNERVKDFIRKNPGTTLLGAAALGFIIGKWASRR
jgi:ElaB/YqjD/DUF883 family membrane-anchored ribosome-binding protein